MNILDVVFAIILIFGAVQGFRKGLFVALAGLVGLIAGIYGAIHFSHFAADYLVQKTSWSEATINLAAFAITFIIIVLVVSLAGKLLTRIADFAMLGIINKIAGAVFEVLKYGLLLSVVLMFLDAANKQIGFVSEETIEDSILYSSIQPIAPALLPSILENAEKADAYRKGHEESLENDETPK